MNHFHFETLSDRLDTCVDGRSLYLKIEFSNVPVELVKDAAIEFYLFANDFYQDQFISLWRFSRGDRSFFPKDVIREIKDSQYSPIFSIESNVRTPVNYSKKHFREFKRRLFYDSTIRAQDYSTDFDSYYDRNIKPAINDSEHLRAATVKLFLEQNRKPIQRYHAPDSQGGFFSLPEYPGSTSRHGLLAFSIAVDSLGDKLNNAAKLFADELQIICSILGTACGRVSVCPYQYAIGNNIYMHYYGERDLSTIDQDMPERIRPCNWNQVAYLCGFEWANVLSPYARKKMDPILMQKSKDDTIGIEILPNRGAFIHLNMPIDSVDVDELLKLKRFLYPALYPGKSAIPAIWGFNPAQSFPRSRWERVPFFSEEIKVENGYIIFEKSSVVLSKETSILT